LQQHGAALQGHGQLDALGQRTLKNAANLPRALHDIRGDRRIEAKIKPHYGSLRAQKLLLNQLQNDRAFYIQAARTMRRIRNVKSLLRYDATGSYTTSQKRPACTVCGAGENGWTIRIKTATPWP